MSIKIGNENRPLVYQSPLTNDEQYNNSVFKPDRKTYEKQERHIVPKGTSNRWPVLFATNILPISGQTRGGLSIGIFNRRVGQEIASIAKG